MDPSGPPLLAGYFHPMVLGRFGLLGLEHFGGYVAHWLGGDQKDPPKENKNPYSVRRNPEKQE